MQDGPAAAAQRSRVLRRALRAAVISPGSKPLKLRSKSAELRSSSLRLSSSSSQSAQETLLLTIKRKAFTWVGVYSSQSSTGTSAMPSLRAAFRGVHLQPRHRCGKHGIFNPNSRMLPHINSLPRNRRKKAYHNLLKIDLLWRNLSEGALYAGLSNRVCGCHSTPGSSSLHFVFLSWGGRARSNALRHGPALLSAPVHASLRFWPTE